MTNEKNEMLEQKLELARARDRKLYIAGDQNWKSTTQKYLACLKKASINDRLVAAEYLHMHHILTLGCHQFGQISSGECGSCEAAEPQLRALDIYRYLKYAHSDKFQSTYEIPDEVMDNARLQLTPEFPKLMKELTAIGIEYTQYEKKITSLHAKLERKMDDLRKKKYVK